MPRWHGCCAKCWNAARPARCPRPARRRRRRAQAQAQALARQLPELRPEPALGGALLPADGARLVLLSAVQSPLADVGVRRVAVDDLHFADEARLELLHSLLDADALLEAGRLRCIALAPLTLAETGELLRSLDVPAARVPASATVGALIERHLKSPRSEALALALARLAAVAGADYSPALAEAVSGRPALAMADAWAELEAAQVLRERAFAHDLVWEAAHRGIPQPIAEHLHATVARHLQAHGGEPARLAAH